MFCFQCEREVAEYEYNYDLGICVYCKELNDKLDEKDEEEK